MFNYNHIWLNTTFQFASMKRNFKILHAWTKFINFLQVVVTEDDNGELRIERENI